MDIKKISLTFKLEQVCNDILTKCFVVSQNLQDEAQKDIRANIESPDATETQSIINRAITEAIGNLKIACQRYLTVGRTKDNNNLERIVKGVKSWTYTENKSAGNWTETVKTTLYDGSEPKTETKTVSSPGEDREELLYDEVTFDLEIPNWNIAVTDGLKSHMHRYIVDYVMSQFLTDQYSDAASRYAESVTTDYGNVQRDLLSRDNYTHRRPSWT